MHSGRLWTRYHNSQTNRDNHSFYTSVLVVEGALCDGFTFRNFTRVSPTIFEYLVNLVGPTITKKDTKLRNAITAGIINSI